MPGTGVAAGVGESPSVAEAAAGLCGAVAVPDTAAKSGAAGAFMAPYVLGTPHARIAEQKKIVAAMVLTDICVYYRTLDRFRVLTFTFGDPHMSSTRFRTGAAALAAALVVALLAFIPSFSAPASAASPAVGVGTPTNRYTPNVVTIPAGGTVTFNWVAGTHTVVLPSGATPDLTINSANPTGTTTALETPGTYYFYCSIHADASDATEAHVQANDAMVGKIIVLAADATPPPATTSPTQASPTTPPAATSPSATTPANGQCILTVKDQTVTADSKTIIIPKSQQGRAGYIAIHESSATGAPGPVIGVTSFEPAGTVYTNLAVGLDRPLKNGETIWPMLHTEDNGNQTYDGAAVDLPTVDQACGNTAAANIVTFPMKVTFGATAGVLAPATGSGVSTSSSSNTWLFVTLGGLVGLAIIAGGTTFAVRRR